MAATVVCPSCEASIRVPAGRREAIARCPWCGAALAAGGEPAREITPVGHTEDRPPPAGRSEAAVAVSILLVSAVVAVGAFFVARHLATPAPPPDPAAADR